MSATAQQGRFGRGSRLAGLLPGRQPLRRGVVLSSAAAMFAGIAAIQLSLGGSIEASGFYVVPIALIALEFGLLAGLASAVVGVALLAGVAEARGFDFGALGYWSRGTAFLSLGAFLGYVSDHVLAPHAAEKASIEPARELEEQLEHLADHDALTGLLNRRRFELELAHRVAETTNGTTGAVLLLDLDNFRYINDTAGHRAGDEVIRSVASLIRDRLPREDVLARLSGDEFAVLLPRADMDWALSVGEELVGAVRGHTVSVGGVEARVTVSAGLTLYHGHDGTTPEELLVEADLAMYEAKEAGRDRLALYTPARDSQGRMVARLNWVERIREALEKDLFTLYCQPIMDLRTGTVSQYELLLRMVDEDGTVILPAAFLGTAERFGLITAIDRWVVRQAIRLIAEHERVGRDLRLEVNLSGKSVGDPELPALIERELAATRINPANLILEVTETAAIANMDDAREFATRLRDLGCRFALDDFGTGFGSFYYLKHLPLNYLKIDGEFIAGLPFNLTDQLVVKAMVQVADGLVEETIAEFVGDRETIELLQQYGVGYAQGYHVGRPCPVSEIWADGVGAAAA